MCEVYVNNGHLLFALSFYLSGFFFSSMFFCICKSNEHTIDSHFEVPLGVAPRQRRLVQSFRNAILDIILFAAWSMTVGLVAASRFFKQPAMFVSCKSVAIHVFITAVRKFNLLFIFMNLFIYFAFPTRTTTIVSFISPPQHNTLPLFITQVSSLFTYFKSSSSDRSFFFHVFFFFLNNISFPIPMSALPGRPILPGHHGDGIPNNEKKRGERTGFYRSNFLLQYFPPIHGT